MEKSVDFLDLDFTIMFDSQKLTQGMSLYHDYHKYYPAYRKRTIKNSPYFREKGGRFYVTEKGRIKIIKNMLRKKIDRNSRWDGVWRAVIFDIPEMTRRSRDLLRRELKMLYFKEVQKSVWVTPYDVEKELLVLLKLWTKDFKGNIKILKITEMSNDTDLKKYFKL